MNTCNIASCQCETCTQMHTHVHLHRYEQICSHNYRKDFEYTKSLARVQYNSAYELFRIFMNKPSRIFFSALDYQYEERNKKKGKKEIGHFCAFSVLFPFFFFFQSEVHHTLIVFQTLTSFPTQQDLSHSSLSVHPIITDIVKIHAEKICPRRVRWRWQVWEKSLLTETFFFFIYPSIYVSISVGSYLSAGGRKVMSAE